MEEKEWELLALSNAIERLIHGVAFFKPDGTLNYINPAILKMWGYDEEERESLIGTCAFDYLAPASRQKIFHGKAGE